MFDKRKILYNNFTIEKSNDITNNEKSKFIVTVDTEADNAWTKPTEIKLDNIKSIPRFQEQCERYGVIPTYLITYECATRDEAIKVLKPILEKDKCEIGHHLHVWTTPPFQEDNGQGVDLAWIHAYQSELPDSLFFEKAEVLKQAIEKNYGVSPKSHRAGRWGIDVRTIKWLINNEFKVDTSFLPLTDFSGMKGKRENGPNFFFESFEPFIINNNSNILNEIPVSVNNTPTIIIELLRTIAYLNILDTQTTYKIIRKINKGTKLTPNLETKIELYLNTIKNSIKKRNGIINFSLHSSEISLGHSPITKTENGYKYFTNVVEQSFKLASELNLTFSKLSDIRL